VNQVKKADFSLAVSVRESRAAGPAKELLQDGLFLY